MAALERVKDDNGEEMWMQRDHKNRYTAPTFSAHTIENMVHLPLRDDDVILVSYPKSGTHWLYENLRYLVSGKIISDDLEKGAGMLEIYEHGHFDNHPSPRILNTHTYFDDMPADIQKGKAKVVLIYRNPKDIAVSFYHHHSRLNYYEYKGIFSNYIKRFTQGKVSSGCCFDYWKMWEEGLAENPQIPHIVLRYEDLHKDPIGERRRLSAFLGKDYDDAFLQEVTKATSIDSMKLTKGVASKKNETGDLIWYRKGQVGDWKNHFTVDQSEWFDHVVEEKMGNSKLFKFVYSI